MKKRGKKIKLPPELRGLTLNPPRTILEIIDEFWQDQERRSEYLKKVCSEAILLGFTAAILDKALDIIANIRDKNKSGLTSKQIDQQLRDTSVRYRDKRDAFR